MKTTSSLIARALIEESKAVSEGEIPSLVDAALHLLFENGLEKDIRSFPRVVQDEFHRTFGIVDAVLSTPSGEAAGLDGAIQKVLEVALEKSVDLSVTRDPSLLGGALLAVGDERFDASLRGALQHLSQHLSLAS